MPRKIEDLEFNEDLPPWSIQDDESTVQFDYFVMFRDLGPSRTVRAVARLKKQQEDGFSLLSPADQETKVRGLSNVLLDYARRNGWRPRAKAYDAWLDAERVDEVRKQRRESITRAASNHQKLSEILISLVGKAALKKHQPETAELKKAVEAELESLGLGALIGHSERVVELQRRVLDMDELADKETAEQEQQSRGGNVFSVEEAKRIYREAIATLPPPPQPIELPPPPEDEPDEPEVTVEPEGV